jgi:hypothetical protein
MFEELFTGPIALARQHQSLFPEERRQFFRHLKDLGYARNTLHAVACELVVITRHLDLLRRRTQPRASAFGVAGTDAGRDVRWHRRRRTGRPEVPRGRCAPGTR